MSKDEKNSSGFMVCLPDSDWVFCLSLVLASWAHQLIAYKWSQLLTLVPSVDKKVKSPTTEHVGSVSPKAGVGVDS